MAMLLLLLAAVSPQVDAGAGGCLQAWVETVEPLGAAAQAGLHYPEVLNMDGVLRTLDSGTVLLSYALIGEQPYLFVLSGQAQVPDRRKLAVLELKTTCSQLATEVQFLRKAMASQRFSDDGRDRMLQRASRLYETLLRTCSCLSPRSSWSMVLSSLPAPSELGPTLYCAFSRSIPVTLPAFANPSCYVDRDGR